ncbi:AMP-binding protein [Kitasatospora arboriphila]
MTALVKPLPLDLGPLFEVLAERRPPIRVELGRPLDLAADGGSSWTTERLADLVRDTAAWLAAAGARPGDRVAVVKRNHWDYVLLACAAVRIGAVPRCSPTGCRRTAWPCCWNGWSPPSW